MVINPWNVPTDECKSNTSSSIRTRCTATAKAKIIIMHTIESEQLWMLQFVKKHNLLDKFKCYLGTHKGSWPDSMQRDLIIETVSKDHYAKESILDKSTCCKSQCQAM